MDRRSSVWAKGCHVLGLDGVLLLFVSNQAYACGVRRLRVCHLLSYPISEIMFLGTEDLEVLALMIVSQNL